jgi:hypothetical protein
MNDAGEAVVTCEVGVEGKTGVEMEALTGATVAALTVYGTSLYRCPSLPPSLSISYPLSSQTCARHFRITS